MQQRRCALEIHATVRTHVLGLVEICGYEEAL
jgi:hypothetical protein